MIKCFRCMRTENLVFVDEEGFNEWLCPKCKKSYDASEESARYDYGEDFGLEEIDND